MGLMLAEPGYHTRAFVEWEEWPQTVLIAAQRAGYFAAAPIWDDLRSFDARPTGSGTCVALSRSCPWPRARGSGGRRTRPDPQHSWISLKDRSHELPRTDRPHGRQQG